VSSRGLRVVLPPDPPLRPDGRCAHCGGPRTPPEKLHRAEALADPFCCTDCAKAWHGVER
jgi:hypothetical protein